MKYSTIPTRNHTYSNALRRRFRENGINNIKLSSNVLKYCKRNKKKTHFPIYQKMIRRYSFTSGSGSSQSFNLDLEHVAARYLHIVARYFVKYKSATELENLVIFKWFREGFRSSLNDISTVARERLVKAILTKDNGHSRLLLSIYN